MFVTGLRATSVGCICPSLCVHILILLLIGAYCACFFFVFLSFVVVSIENFNNILYLRHHMHSKIKSLALI